MKEIEQTLNCTSGGSDKVYQLALKDVGGGWRVFSKNGRRGKAMTINDLSGNDMHYTTAEKLYHKKLSEKIKKDYHLYSGMNKFLPELEISHPSYKGVPAPPSKKEEVILLPKVANIILEDFAL